MVYMEEDKEKQTLNPLEEADLFMQFAPTWKELEHTMLSEDHQNEGDRCRMISHMWDEKIHSGEATKRKRQHNEKIDAIEFGGCNLSGRSVGVLGKWRWIH